MNILDFISIISLIILLIIVLVATIIVIIDNYKSNSYNRYLKRSNKVLKKLRYMDQDKRDYILSTVRQYVKGYLEGDDSYFRKFDFTEKEEQKLDKYINKNLQELIYIMGY